MNQPQLPIDEVPPGYYGHSVGKWDGDTLVVDTVGIKESVLGLSEHCRTAHRCGSPSGFVW